MLVNGYARIAPNAIKTYVCVVRSGSFRREITSKLLVLIELVLGIVMLVNPKLMQIKTRSK